MTLNGQALSRDAERLAHEQARVEADARRRARFEAARNKVRSFADGHVDVCAMALIMLEWMGGPVTQTAIRERAHSQYDWIFHDGEGT
jgi:hypothetical protein